MTEKENRSISNAEPLSADLQAVLTEIRENVRALRQRGADADGRLAALETQVERAESIAKERYDSLRRSAECLRETMEAKIQIAKSEMMREFYEAKTEMMKELYKTKTEISADLYAEHTKQMSDLSRKVKEWNNAASPPKPAAESPSPNGHERN